MLNDAPRSKGAAADVYSLAKTLWVLATGQAYPLPGAYERGVAAFQIGASVAEAGTGRLDSVIAAATVFDPAARPSMAQVATELDAWLQPPAVAPAPIRLDLASYAAELQTRKAAADSENERAQQQQKRRDEAGLRIRERFRPLAKDIEVSLREADFSWVSLNIDRYHYGFEVAAGIPQDGTAHMRLTLRVSFDTSALPAVKASAIFQLESIRQGQTAANMQLWEMETSFLEGGSEEERQVHRMDAALREELPRVVMTAVSIALDKSSRAPRASAGYQIKIVNTVGAPVQGAEVYVLSVEGTYLRSRTNDSGIAGFGASAFRATAVFAAHAEYRAACMLEAEIAPIVELKMNAQKGSGSIAVLRGWATIPGLSGEIDFLRDGQGQLYFHTKNLDVEGGQGEPVHFTLGQHITLRDAKGASVAIRPVAVQGPCFLIDVIRM